MVRPAPLLKPWLAQSAFNVQPQLEHACAREGMAAIAATAMAERVKCDRFMNRS
jgi:hypothetical protein